VTTSYILQRQAELKEMKRLERQVEQSMMAKAMSDAIERHAADKARVLAKEARIASGEPAPKPVETKPEVVEQKQVAVEITPPAPVVAQTPNAPVFAETPKVSPKPKATSKKTTKKGK
tara:strand:+ start:1195 stop:1548 length:354 start_codon:yes stop_codon:yes gene_type:complete